ncbi:MAG: rod shape-determining protein MreD [Nitrospiraceae bacterium]|nr:rod shape-determining protein MreD [Nitrospiraceae bacterium]
MKPRAYVVIFLLLLPLQAAVLSPLARIGIRPDLALALAYLIGLLTGPVEGAIAGMGIGLLQDIGSASLIGFSGITHGAVGYLAGFLGQRVLDIQSPSNVIFLALFCLAQSLLAALFLDLTYGSFPLFRQFFIRMVPQALFTAIAGHLILRYATRRTVLPLIRRRELQKEM